ncbi:MAG: DUF2029 domain-containing protein [Proteobacteria bacterium]|nr:DUF2029 domain-containing protein [Pseudomonadota bacterium]
MNVPIVAWVLTPFAWLGRLPADLAFAALGLTSIAATLVLLTRLGTAVMAPCLCLMFLLNGPLWYCLLLGNSTEMVLLCLVAALTLWRRQWGYTVGLIIGVAAVIKPMLILFGLYFAFKREWRVVAGGATVIIGALLASVLVAGLDNTLYWYQHTVGDFAGKPMPAYNVQSIEAFILRLSKGPASATDWYPHMLPVWGKIIRDVVFVSLFALLGAALWLGQRRVAGEPARRPGAQESLEFCLVLTFCLVTSTVSWTHYYLLLLLPYALYFTGNLPLRDDRLTHGLVWTSLIFCSLPVHEHIFGSAALEGIFFRTLQSVWLFGGLLLFAALVRGAIAPDRPVVVNPYAR